MNIVALYEEAHGVQKQAEKNKFLINKDYIGGIPWKENSLGVLNR